MMFIVIKEFEPQDPDAYFKGNVVDNIVFILSSKLPEERQTYTIYVNRKNDSKNHPFIPYMVSATSIKKVLSFLAFIFCKNSSIQIDMYHGSAELIGDVSADIDSLSKYKTEQYSVVGFARDSSISKSLLIKNALKQLRNFSD